MVLLVLFIFTLKSIKRIKVLNEFAVNYKNESILQIDHIYIYLKKKKKTI